MKFSCLQENLSKGLQTISKALPTKSALPILANVLIKAENGRLQLAATNLETAITTVIGASVEEEGAITVPAKLLRDFVSNLPAGTINAHLTNEILHVSSQKTKSKFNGVAATEYPALPEFPQDPKNILELDPKQFSNAVSVVAFSSGTDESRPVFTGLLMNYNEGKLTLASTDGFRLSEKILNLENAEVAPFSTIIPAKTLLEVARIFSNSAESLKIILNPEENLALFKSEDTFVATRILEGQYPDYHRIIPSESILKACFDTNEFAEAVKLTNIFAKEGSSALKIRFDPEEGIKVLNLSAEAGENVSVLTGEIEGEALEVAFSSKYLLEFLSNVKTTKIIFATNGNVSPCILRTEEIDDFLHIIMPMQI